MGGAKSPKPIIDDSIEKKPIQTLNSISVAPPAKKVVEKEEKRTPEGLRPGERLNKCFFLSWLFLLYLNHIFAYSVQISRFKQLKEQEARKKRQREEEIRKAEEAAANGLQITNGKVNKEITSLEGEASSSNIDGISVNGNNVKSESKDDEKSSAVREENPGILDDRKNERSNLHMDKNIEKVLYFCFHCNLLLFYQVDFAPLHVIFASSTFIRSFFI